MRTTAILTAVFLALATAAIAVEQPRLIPRSARIDRPVEQVFDTLKQYFSGPSLSMFNLVSADRKNGTIVARRAGIDTAHWTDWAFCEAEPMKMIYKFEDGTATVTVKVEASGNNRTFASVTADFQGTYGLASSENKIACVSKGSLEENILAVARGAASHPSN
ncbi:MAG TPA: hypothetical protein VEC38_14350 [Candidatus Binataceae bacterium]|nr:hypothetical protein [Candidatus Binataceae bacterium]